MTGLLSIPAVPCQQGRQVADTAVCTFLDYELEPAGHSETLMWSQVHQRTQIVAGELASCESPGDRVAISAPQDLTLHRRVLRFAGGRFRAGVARLDSNHHQRQGPPLGLRGRYRHDEFIRLDRMTSFDQAGALN